MNTFFKYLVRLLILDLLILIAGFLITRIADPGFRFSDLTILTLLFSIITGIILFIFFRGQKKDQENQSIHMMVFITLKFLLDIVLAVIWFFISKKTSYSYLILFFILYLAFTFFSTFVMLKTLKTKSL